MPTSDTVLRDLYTELKKLHIHECELHSNFSKKIFHALEHHLSNTLVLDDTNQLDANFIDFSHQLALHRLFQFKQRISERASQLTESKAVRETFRLIGLRMVIKCDLNIEPDYYENCTKEEKSQQITMALLRLQVCSNSLAHQLSELTCALEVWTSINATTNQKRVSTSKLNLKNPRISITKYSATQPVSKSTYSYNY